MAEGTPLPLKGVLVVDLSRMLPGAVLARQLIDLGARLIKVEDPQGGDPMRQVPPLADGVGVGFAGEADDHVDADRYTRSRRVCLPEPCYSADGISGSSPGGIRRGHDRTG